MLNFKTWKRALKSRDHRRLAADRHEYTTSKQFFKVEYLPVPLRINQEIIFGKKSKNK